jgi:hypothetical protein
MDDSSTVFRAAQIVDDLERSIGSLDHGAPARDGAPSLADAPDGAANVPGVPEPPD